MDFFEPGFLGLFVFSFLSATLLPLSSEGVLFFMLAAGFDPIICIGVASVGNILGGTTNFFIGRIGNPMWFARLKIKEASILRFESRTKQYGFWLALLSWLPIIGDPLILALGFFRAPFLPVLLCMSLGKIIRYFVIALPWLL